jgi:hypothetical protein
MELSASGSLRVSAKNIGRHGRLLGHATLRVCNIKFYLVFFNTV